MMKIKFTEEEKTEIIKLYHGGLTQREIGKRYGICENTVSKLFKIWGVKKKTFCNLYSEEEKETICNLYRDRNWTEIFKLFPNIKKQQVYKLASDRKVRIENYHWNDADIEFLKQHYKYMSYVEIQKHLIGNHPVKSIGSKAISLGLTKPRNWSTEEIEIVQKYYSILPRDELQKMLPERTYVAIGIKGQQLGLKSYQYLNERFSKEDEEFVIQNWTKMTDKEIGDILGRVPHAISDKRSQLGLSRINKDYGGYVNLQKLLRGQIFNWKKESQEACNYCCVLTGSKDYQIHHLYSFNKIFEQAMVRAAKEGLKISDSIEDYSKDELDQLIHIFLEIHETYPLGVCIRKDLHTLFHQKYGQGGNTPEQWERFIAQMKQENIA